MNAKMNAKMSMVPDGQTWDEDVLRRISAHVEAERDVLAEYARAIESIDAPDIRYLIQLILDDERRHHRIFQEIARAAQAAREWRNLEPKVPALTHRRLPEAVRALTSRLLTIERDDERELKALRRTLKPVADTTLWALLVDVMALDTKKHERILEFIAEHANG